MEASSISERIAQLNESIRETASRVHRRAEDVRYLLVTKTVQADTIRAAFLAGVLNFGENRVQELTGKMSELAGEIRWHLIGHLQTNKVKQILGKVVLIHSLDRLELLEEIEKQATQRSLPKVPCLIQVNASGERTKFGLKPEVVPDFVGSVREDSPVEIQGLMTIGPLTREEGPIREAFRKTRELRDRLRDQFPKRTWNTLSMGMSEDYKIAIEEGATLLRIGRAVFGARGQ